LRNDTMIPVGMRIRCLLEMQRIHKVRE
jgi:hypothetical protein